MAREKNWIPHLRGKNFDEAFNISVIKPAKEKIENKILKDQSKVKENHKPKK